MAEKTKAFLTLLTEGQHAELTAAADAEGVSMGTIMRDALDAYLRSIGPVSIDVHMAEDDPEDYAS